jgi:hypothetical protein
VVGIKSEIAPGILQDIRGNFSIISERLRNLVGTIIGKILLRESSKPTIFSSLIIKESYSMGYFN